MPEIIVKKRKTGHIKVFPEIYAGYDAKEVSSVKNSD